ncbi:MAG TPA: thiamine-phosphate kinase [Phycisphaerales bacterium]|nr:thiamine-phosphate kinase [Phycisphaerales bacterium]
MRESELLRHIYRRSDGLDAGGPIVIGPGDDCAAIRTGAGLSLVTVDQLVEGRHFTPDTPIDLVARKAVARSASDIAAMGGTPIAGFAAACLPAGYTNADELFDRMAHWAQVMGCPLAGGDIAMLGGGQPGPLVLGVTVIGSAHPVRGPVRRSDAHAGDDVYVTGRLGGSFRSGRHLTFTPRVKEGTWLCGSLEGHLGAMIDLSDGAGRDAARVAEMSRVRIELEASLLPMNDGVSDWRSALGDGEDYELLFTVRPGGVLPEKGPGTDTQFTRIGRVTEGAGCFVRTRDGEMVNVAEIGWDHHA